MNKQEALEAVLVEVRKFEASGAEVPAADSFYVAQEMADLVRQFEVVMGQQASRRKTAKLRALLVQIAACAVHLLRDEVEVVEGE